MRIDRPGHARPQDGRTGGSDRHRPVPYDPPTRPSGNATARPPAPACIRLGALPVQTVRPLEASRMVTGADPSHQPYDHTRHLIARHACGMGRPARPCQYRPDHRGRWAGAARRRQRTDRQPPHMTEPRFIRHRPETGFGRLSMSRYPTSIHPRHARPMSNTRTLDAIKPNPRHGDHRSRTASQARTSAYSCTSRGAANMARITSWIIALPFRQQAAASGSSPAIRPYRLVGRACPPPVGHP